MGKTLIRGSSVKERLGRMDVDFIDVTLTTDIETHANGDVITLPIEIENEETYAKVMLGECDPCGDASTSVKNIFDGFSYDKVLVGGLGLGLLPEYLKTVKNCSVVDVVENNNELITWTNSNKHLNENINIIESDAYSYTPDKKYDLILIDLWWDKADITQQNETDLKNNYNSHLESNGKIVLPVAEKEL